MFIAHPDGRVTVYEVLNYSRYFFSRYHVLISCRHLGELLANAAHEYKYTQNEFDLFCVSLGFLLPLLLTGESYMRRGNLVLPSSLTELYLRWGLATCYFPEFAACPDELTVNLSTMSTRSRYEQLILRIGTHCLAKDVSRQHFRFQHGVEFFKRFIQSRLLLLESRLPLPRRTSPLAPGPLVDRLTKRSLLARVVGHNELLFTGVSSGITRYYNFVALEGLPVAFWDATGISLHHAGERYFEGSHLQKILQ